MREKIIEMLGKGIPATQVASAVGCEDSYISQLLSEPGVTEEVTSLKATHFSKYLEQDGKADDAEAMALKKLTSLIPFITRPAEAARAYAVLNAAKRKTVDNVASALPVQAVVSLELPAATRVRFTVTHDKQVIEVEGRSMTTMPAANMAQKLAQRHASRLLTADVPTTLGVKVPEVAERMPAYSTADQTISNRI